MQAREVAERNPGVDVVGEVPTDVVRHEHEPRRGVLARAGGGTVNCFCDGTIVLSNTLLEVVKREEVKQKT